MRLWQHDISILVFYRKILLQVNPNFLTVTHKPFNPDLTRCNWNNKFLCFGFSWWTLSNICDAKRPFWRRRPKSCSRSRLGSNLISNSRKRNWPKAGQFGVRIWFFYKEFLCRIEMNPIHQKSCIKIIMKISYWISFIKLSISYK